MPLKSTSLKSVVIFRVSLVFLIIYSLTAFGLYQLIAQHKRDAQISALQKQSEHLVQVLEKEHYDLTDTAITNLLALPQNILVTVAEDAATEVGKVSLESGNYVLTSDLPTYSSYLTLSQQQFSNSDVIWPLIIGGLVFMIALVLVLSESLTREFRVFDRINKVFRSVIAQPNLKTLPVSDITYIETHDLLSNLNEMMAILEEQNQKQLRFISDVSHELRTPVSVIKGYMSMLLRWGKEDTVVLNESLQASLKETSRMEIMIKDMLDMIRIQGSFEDHLNDVTDVDDSLDTVLSNFKVLYNDVIFNTHIDDVLPLAKLYHVHFEQILVILIDNAIKYSPAKKEIDISAQAIAGQVQLTVRDQGQGISEEDVKHIFDRFFRTSESRNRQETSAGVGIGLSLLKQITDAYGITIQVHSAVGQGTAFVLNFPTAEWPDGLPIDDEHDDVY